MPYRVRPHISRSQHERMESMSENYSRGQYQPQSRTRTTPPHLRAESARRQPSGRGSSPQRRKPSSGGSGGGRGITLIALLVIAVIVGGGVWMWLNRTVYVSVNGQSAEVKIDSGLTDILSVTGVSPKPGNLVSVGGNVLEEGGGTAFTVKVNGDELTEGEIDSFRAKGNEAISFGDGTDVTESSHEEERESQPKLEPASSVGAVTFVSQYGKTGRQKFTVGDISGEAIEGEVIEPVQNVKIESVNVRPENGRKVVALTFDDGPSKYTQRYLDILSKYGARATFFCLGSQIPGNEGLVQAIKNQGSQVASHTQNHEQLTLLDPDALRSEVTQTFSAISSAGGGDTTVLRPPYGALDTSTWAASGGTFSASIIWNLDSLDWELPGVDTIVENCTLGVTSGSIILMHDGGGNRDQDVEALPRIIETLQGQGYELVTINELLATDSRIPESVASGNATIPEGHVWASEVVE